MPTANLSKTFNHFLAFADDLNLWEFSSQDKFDDCLGQQLAHVCLAARDAICSAVNMIVRNTRQSFQGQEDIAQL